MKFRIFEHKDNGKTRYEIFYFDELNNKGAKWQKVIWDEKSICNFQDNNFVDTLSEADAKAKEFYIKWQQEHGKLVSEFNVG